MDGLGRILPDPFRSSHAKTVLRIVVVFLSICYLWAAPAAGQENHIDIFSRMAAQCLAQAVDESSSFRLQADGQATFLTTKLVDRWSATGKKVYRLPSPDSDATASLPLLSYTVDKAELSYQRLSRKTLQRNAILGITYWLTANDGQVLKTDSCLIQENDEISRADATRFADRRFPETSPPLPAASRWRNVVEPLVLVGASAVGTYLFFNLRSRRSGSG